MGNYRTGLLAAVLILLQGWNTVAKSQHILEKKIDVDFNQIPVHEALAEMERAAAFSFSYNTEIISPDSIVTLKDRGASVEKLLNDLFKNKYQYGESGNFLIITLRPKALQIITTDISSDRNSYSVSGLIVEEATNSRLPNVSVYAKQTLEATLSDEHGYFKLNFRNGASGPLTLTASKLGYSDANVNFLQTLAVSDRKNTRAYMTAASNGKGVEKEGFGRFMIGTRQLIQSLNIPDFFANRPIQISVSPGLSTHGLMSSQVVNEVSLNLVGGYTAGVKGFELGTVFNINRLDAKYLQVAGVFNVVGGAATGLQVAGISNETLGGVNGVQIAGFVNNDQKTVSGVQIAGLKNEAHVLKGVQIGLINKVDSSRGASIGLLNFIGNGFYKVGISANDVINTNVSLSTGTHDFYTILHAGYNAGSRDPNSRLAFGFGLGHDFMINKRLYLSAIGDYQIWGDGNSFRKNWKQAKLLMNVQLSDHFSIYAGPTFRHYVSDISLNYLYSQSGYIMGSTLDRNYKTKFGWDAGIAYNSAFRRTVRKSRPAENWYMGLSANVANDISFVRPSIGSSVFVLREFNNRFAATLSAGYFTEVRSDRLFSGDFYGKIVEARDDFRFRRIPVKAGIRAYEGKRFFFSAELGFLAGLNNPNYLAHIDEQGKLTKSYYGGTPHTMIASAGIGYVITGGLEAQLHYDHYWGNVTNQIGLSVNYKFKISR